FAAFYATPRQVDDAGTGADAEPAAAHTETDPELAPAEKVALLGPPGADRRNEPADAAGRRLHRVSPSLTWPLLPLAIGSILFGYVQFPMGGLGQVLGPALGPAPEQALASGP